MVTEPIPPTSTHNDSPPEKFVECVRDCFLHQHISEPTRFRHGQTPSRDDLIFSNKPELLDHLKLLDPLGASDHVAISFKLNHGTPFIPPPRNVPNYNKADYKEMKKELDIDWEKELENKSVQEMADTIDKAIRATEKEHVPIKRQNFSTSKRKPIWMNESSLRKV